jgi:hypothetical protein
MAAIADALVFPISLVGTQPIQPMRHGEQARPYNWPRSAFYPARRPSTTASIGVEWNRRDAASNRHPNMNITDPIVAMRA